jgi:hypothetical protein
VIDHNTRQAAAVLRQYMGGQLPYQTAQARVRRYGFDLQDPELAAEITRQDQEAQAERHAAEARQRERAAIVNAYMRREYDRVKGITLDGL